MAQRPSKLLVLALSAAVFVAPGIDTAVACTRTLYVGTDNTVITGRNMDWMEDMASNLWLFPAAHLRNLGIPNSRRRMRAIFFPFPACGNNEI